MSHKLGWRSRISEIHSCSIDWTYMSVKFELDLVVALRRKLIFKCMINIVWKDRLQSHEKKINIYNFICMINIWQILSEKIDCNLKLVAYWLFLACCYWKYDPKVQEIVTDKQILRSSSVANVSFSYIIKQSTSSSWILSL